MISFTFTPPSFDHPKITQAIARGLNEGGDKVRTQVQRELKRTTNVKNYRSITSRIRTVRAGPGSLRYELVTRSKPIPLTEFKTTVTDHGIEGSTWGDDLRFKRSFVLHGRFTARTGPGRHPLIRLQGANLAKDFGRHGVPEVFQQAAAQFVPVTVLKHMVKAIG